MDNLSAATLIFWIFVTAVALVLTLLVARGRTALGMKLTGLGIIMAFVALWYGLLTTGLPSKLGGPLPQVVPLPGGAGLADVALRLAAVLVLGGVVVSLLTREAGSIAPVSPEVPRHVPPTV